MRRNLFGLATAASVILCLSLLVAWASSHWFLLHLYCQDWARTSYGVSCTNGRVSFSFVYSAYYETDPLGRASAERLGPSNEPPHGPDRSAWNRIGFWSQAGERDDLLDHPPPPGWHAPIWFRWVGLPTDRAVVFRAVGVPVWLPVLVTAVLPAWRFERARRVRRRLARGHCPACGYDLRASPERCPECGAVGGGGA